MNRNVFSGSLAAVIIIVSGFVEGAAGDSKTTAVQSGSKIYDYARSSKGEKTSAAKPAALEISKDILKGPFKDIERIVFAVRGLQEDVHWYANIGYYCQDQDHKIYVREGRLCVLNLHSGVLQSIIEDPLGSVRDPVVHYDGKTILFSYRKGGTETYHLYTIQADGSGLKQITGGGEYDDYEPCWLPDGGIVFVTTRAKRWVNCWITQVGNIWRCDSDGSNMRALSANLEQDNTPWVMPDGRLLYMRWEYIDRSQMDYHHLWTMNPDGTGQMVYFGNLHPGGVFIDAKPIPGTDEVVLINSPSHGTKEHAGFVATLNVRKGPDDRASMKNLSKERGYRDPWALSSDVFMAAKSNKLVMFDRLGSGTEVFALPDAFGNVLLNEPRPLIPRKRETIMPPRVDLNRTTGTFLVNDVYIGRNMAGVKPGEIKKLMIIEVLPKPVNFTGGMDPMSYMGTFSLERVLGTVPVEADGSAHFEAPALRSLFFVSLDAEGRSVKRMQSFTTVQPGETFSCIGCHEDRAAGRMPVSRKLPDASRRAPSVIEPFRGVPDLPDFCKDVQPVLDRNCVSCHNNDKRSGGVNLSGDRGPMFTLSYYALTVFGQLADGRNYARSNYPPRALGSGGAPLTAKIDGSHHKVKADERDRLIIRLWLDIGAPFPGTYAALGCGSIGGYIQNWQVLNNDANLPSTKAAEPVFSERCISCHSDKHTVARSLSDEMGLGRPDMRDPRLKYSRHAVFNLSNPGKSLILQAPLSRKAGGLGLCRFDGAQKDADSTVFTGKEDPCYKLLLGMCEGGKAYLNEIKRFDMPGFKPRPEYVREMKRFKVLPPAFDLAKDPIDVYATDRAYWDIFNFKPIRREQ